MRRQSLVINVERELIEDHIANCRNFVLEWTTKPRPPDNSAIITQLSRIDKNIREKWCKLYRDEVQAKTFSSCIRETMPMADTLWSADLTNEMRPDVDGSDGVGGGSSNGVGDGSDGSDGDRAVSNSRVTRTPTGGPCAGDRGASHSRGRDSGSGGRSPWSSGQGTRNSGRHSGSGGRSPGSSRSGSGSRDGSYVSGSRAPASGNGSDGRWSRSRSRSRTESQ